MVSKYVETSAQRIFKKQYSRGYMMGFATGMVFVFLMLILLFYVLAVYAHVL